MPSTARSWPIGFLVAVAAVSAPATAGPAFSEDVVWADLMATLDLDSDGSISPAELERKADSRHFATIDLDHDGAITVDELAEWVRVTPPRPEQSALIRAPDAAPPTAPPTPPSASVPPPSAAAAPATPAATPSTSAPPAPAGASPLRWAAGAVVVLGVLSLVGGLLIRRSRSGRRRRRR